MEEIDKGWFYEDHRKGGRQGPIDDTQINDLISQNVIQHNTLVWKEGFTDWVRAIETPLRSKFGIIPPPLPASALSNIWAYLLATLPIWSAIYTLAISATFAGRNEYYIAQMHRSIFWIIPAAILNSFMAIRDEKNLSKHGLQVNNGGIWAFFLPVVYLFIRCKHVKKTYLGSTFGAFFPFILYWISVLVRIIIDANLFAPGI